MPLQDQQLVLETALSPLKNKEPLKLTKKLLLEKAMTNKLYKPIKKLPRHAILPAVSFVMALGLVNSAKAEEEAMDYVRAADYNYELVEAAKQQNISQVYRLLENGTSINSTIAPNGTTPLMEASLNGNAKLVTILIQKGAKLNIKDLRGETALQYALRANNMDIAKILVDHGADTSILGKERAASLRKFLAHNAKKLAYTNVTAADEPTTAYKAIYASAKGKKDFGDPLVNAADKGDFKKVKRLISEGHDVDSLGKFRTTALMRAAYRGYTDISSFLISKGAKVNQADEQEMTPVSLAQLGGHPDEQQLLFDHGASSGAYGVDYVTMATLAVAPASAAITATLIGATGGAVALASSHGGAAAAVASSGSSQVSPTPPPSNNNSGNSGSNNPPPPPSCGSVTCGEKNSTGAGTTVAIIGNGVMSSGTYTDGKQTYTTAWTAPGPHSVTYDFTKPNSNGIVVWSSNSQNFLMDGSNAANGQPATSLTGGGPMNGHDTESALIINQIAPDATLLSLRAFDGAGNGFDISSVGNAINYAAGYNTTTQTLGTARAQVMNNSWGVSIYDYINNITYDMTGRNIDGTAQLSSATVLSIINSDVSAESTFPGNQYATGQLTTSQDIKGNPLATDANGNPISLSNPTYNLVDAINHAIANNIVMVWAAGNDSLANPNVTAGLYLIPGSGISANAANLWLVATAVEQNNDGSYTNLQTGSNLCGVAQARCLAAIANSTSHSAAEVSGAVAKLITAGLTPQQASARVLATTYYLNASGFPVDSNGNKTTISSGNAVLSSPNGNINNTSQLTNAITGHGLLNPDLATSSYGSLFVNTSNPANGPVLLSGSSIQLGNAFGDALSKSNINLIAFDNGGNKNSTLGSAAFPVALSSMVSEGNPRINLDQSMSNLGNGEFAQTQQYENGTLQFTPYNQDSNSHTIIAPEDAGRILNGNMSFTFGQDNSNYTLTQNIKMDHAFGFGAISGANTNMQISQTANRNPYLSFATQGENAIMQHTLSDNLTLRMGIFTGAEQDTFDTLMSNNSTAGGEVVEATFNYGHTSFSAQVGSVTETNAFLGSQAQGALSTGQTTPTKFFALAAEQKVTEHFKLYGSYTQGISTLQPGANSLFFGNSTKVQSNAFSIGAAYDGFDRKDTSVGFTISQPLRIESGSVAFAYNSGLDANGNPITSNANVGLSPSGREMDLESYYHTALTTDASATISAMYRIEPGNISTNPNEAILLVKVQKEF